MTIDGALEPPAGDGDLVRRDEPEARRSASDMVLVDDDVRAEVLELAEEILTQRPTFF